MSANAGGGRVETSFYDATAATYDSLMAEPPAPHIRRRFLDLVRSHVAPPGPILDFGCGTGIDARHYACTGYTVLAYDPSVAMLEPLRRRCAGAIRASRVIAVSGSAADCLDAARALAPFGGITSNFSALNHVDEPEPLLAAFGDLLKPGGRMILSLLNPWYWPDMKSGWWWRARMGSVGRSGFVVDLGQNRTVRHDPARIGRRAGLRRVVLRGALHKGIRASLPGHPGDALVFVVLASS
ncbi:MAG: class I SAM-dependent methyltransferase [Longimicrobiales bacterium]